MYDQSYVDSCVAEESEPINEIDPHEDDSKESQYHTCFFVEHFCEQIEQIHDVENDRDYVEVVPNVLDVLDTLDYDL